MMIIKQGSTKYFKQLIPDFKNHWKESGQSELGEFKLDQRAYEAMEKLDLYVNVGAFEGEEIVGYVSCFIFYHPHCSGIKLAQTDSFYVKPSHRGLKGYAILSRMLKEMEIILKREHNVKSFNVSFPAHMNLRRYFERAGYRPLDLVMTKLL